MVRVPLNKSMSKTFDPFKVISETPGTVTLDEDCIHNSDSMYRVIAPPKTQDSRARLTKTAIHKTQIIPELMSEP